MVLMGKRVSMWYHLVAKMCTSNDNSIHVCFIKSNDCRGQAGICAVSSNSNVGRNTGFDVVPSKSKRVCFT